MARVAVINPPKRNRTARRRWKNRHRHVKGYYPNPRRRKRHLSAKARRAAIRNLRRARMKLNPRRRHHRGHKRKITHFINPFAGTLAVMGNPHSGGSGGHRRHKKKRRHTTMAKRRHHRKYRNPFSAGSLMQTPKELVSSENIMEAAGVAAGFILPNMAMNYLPATWRSTLLTYYVTKVGTVVVLSAAGALVSKRVAKFVLVGGSVSLLLDLYAEFVKGTAPVTATTTAPAATTAPATSAFYGNLQAYYGGMVNDWEV